MAATGFAFVCVHVRLCTYAYLCTFMHTYLLYGRGQSSQGQSTLISAGDASTSDFNNNSLTVDEILTISDWTMNSLEVIFR